MEDTVSIPISIPSDNDGYILLQCSHCGDYFKITAQDCKDDSILHLYCPSCGLISDSYMTEETINLAQVKCTNIGVDLVNKFLNDMEKSFSSNSLISLKVDKKLKHEYESPVHSRIDELQIKQYACCRRSAKIKPLLKMSASYCPFCGVISFANE